MQTLKNFVFFAQEKYEDRIEFNTNKGTFSLLLQALLPQTKLYLPESIQFGLVAAHDIVELTFEIKNLRCVKA